jgi:hypothetical protein
MAGSRLSPSNKGTLSQKKCNCTAYISIDTLFRFQRQNIPDYFLLQGWDQCVKFLFGLRILLQRGNQFRRRIQRSVRGIECDGQLNEFTDPFRRIFEHGCIDVKAPFAFIADQVLLIRTPVYSTTNRNRAFIFPGLPEEACQYFFRNRDKRVNPDDGQFRFKGLHFPNLKLCVPYAGPNNTE